MIHWNALNFNKKEFSEDPDLYADESLIYSLDSFRNQTKKPIYPSPIKGALARFDGSETSQHFAIKRKSTAIDFFCEGFQMEVFLLLYKSALFTGIGMYLDTTGPDGKAWIMFHADIRKSKQTVALFWIVKKEYDPIKDALINKYYYPQYKNEYWSLLKNEKLYTERQYNH